MKKTKTKTRVYHPGPIAELIFHKLKKKNKDAPDMVNTLDNQDIEWIVYKGLRIMRRKNIYTVEQYYNRKTVKIENIWLLHLILENI